MGTINRISSVFLRNTFGKPYSGKPLVADGGGLSARITSTGKISWAFRYRLGGREANQEWISLGKYPDTSLQQAREKRDRCRSWIDNGKNPKIELAVKKETVIKPVTNYDALEYWLVEYAEEHRANVDKHRAQFNKHIYPFIGDLPVTETDTRHWIECFDRARKGVKGVQRPAPVATGYMLQNAKQALRFCRVRHYVFSRVLDDLTITDVGKKQNKKDRVLTENELEQVWNMTQEKKFNQYHRNLIKLLLTFGCRTQEIRLSTWYEWDLQKQVWTVPKSHSKTGQKIFRPIPDEINIWLKQLKADADDSDWILGEKRSAETVSLMCGKYWKRLQHQSQWKLHDLRRTFATNMNELGVAPHIVEQLLGHSLGGVMAIYNRSKYLSEKKAALEMWINYLQQGCKLTPCNILPFKANC